MNFYRVSPDSDACASVFENATRPIRIARELWSLVEPARADWLRVLADRDLDRASLDDVRLTGVELEEWVRALRGLADALVGPVLDRDWNIPAESVDAIAAAAPVLEAAPSRSMVERRAAAAEGLSLVMSLEKFLSEARADGDHVRAG